VIFFALVVAVTKPAGVFMYNVFEGKRTFLDPELRPLERLFYRLAGVKEMSSRPGWDIRYCSAAISRTASLT